MATFKTRLIAYLAGDTAITTIVGSRMYTGAVPQSITSDFLKVQRISQNIWNNLGGTDNIYKERWQIDCVSKIDSTAETLSDAVIARLNMIQHNTSNFTGYTVYLIIQDNTNDVEEPVAEGSQQTYFIKQIDFIIKRTK